jgi:hypothetical protein
MSRNNARTARQLREAEALEVRKSILKASANNAYDKQEVFDSLEVSNNNYLARIEKLQSFKAKSKATTKKNTRLMEWDSEYKALENSASTIGKELLNVMEVSRSWGRSIVIVELESIVIQVFVLHSLGDDEIDIQDIVQELQNIDAHTSEYKATVIGQYSELKSLLKSVMNSLQDNSNEGNSGNKNYKRIKNSTTTAPVAKVNPPPPPISSDASEQANGSGTEVMKPNPRASESVCIAAELLLSVRQGHSERGAQLSLLEEKYNQELMDCRRTLVTSWRDEIVGVANKQLQDLLAQVSQPKAGTRSSSQVSREEQEVMLVSEWCSKMKLLEKNYKLACKLIEAEKQSLCLELGIELSDETRTETGDVDEDTGPNDGMDQDDNKSVSNMNGNYMLGGWNRADHMVFLKVLWLLHIL